MVMYIIYSYMGIYVYGRCCACIEIFLISIPSGRDYYIRFTPPLKKKKNDLVIRQKKE